MFVNGPFDLCLSGFTKKNPWMVSVVAHVNNEGCCKMFLQAPLTHNCLPFRKFYEQYGMGPRPFDLSKSNFVSTCQRYVLFSSGQKNK